MLFDQFKVLLNKEKDDPRLKESKEYYQDLLDRAKEDSEQSDGHKLYKPFDKGRNFIVWAEWKIPMSS